MRVHVHFTPDELTPGELTGRTAVVIDVLRATSTMAEALANGARRILPVATVEEAARLGQNLDRNARLLCGERRARRIEGFDLGNSPREFTAEQVAGKTLVMSTTNGTVALIAAAPADRVLVASFLNLAATVAALQASDEIVIVCAGREKRFALEDAVCAGEIVEALRRQARTARLNDGAAAARALSQRYSTRLERLFRHTAAGRQVVEAGYVEDLAFCAQRDRHEIVVELHDREVTAAVTSK